jgi:hypothetical protein
VIVRSARYTTDAPPFRTFVARLVEGVRGTRSVTSARSYLASGDPSLVSRDGHATLIPLAVLRHKDIEPVLTLGSPA